MEEWKDVKSYEGIYQVSNLGRVKSLGRFIEKSNNTKQPIKESILKAGISSEGYYLVMLTCKNKISKSIRVHQLVAMAFLNHTPSKYDVVVDHIDNNPLNNKLENLQLITQRENLSKDKKNKTSKYTGVSWNKQSKKWAVRFYKDGVNEFLGYFDCELLAANAYINRFIEL